MIARGLAFGNAIRCVRSPGRSEGMRLRFFLRANVRFAGPSTTPSTRAKIVAGSNFTMTLERDGKPQAVLTSSISAAPIELPQRRQVLVCIENITARKQAELDLQEAFSEIEQLKDRLQQENVCLREEIQLRYQHQEIIGKSAAIRAVMAQVEQVADTPAEPFCCWERLVPASELFARAIHKLSPRKGLRHGGRQLRGPARVR